MKKAASLIFLIIFTFDVSISHAFLIKGANKILESPAYRIRGTEYLPLTVICDAYSIHWKWDPISRTIDLSKENASVKLRVGEYKVYANGVISIEEKPPLFNNGTVCVPSDFLKTIFNKFFVFGYPETAPKITQREVVPPPITAPRYNIKKIILDPGHGGYDPGAIGRDGIKEKYIVLDIATKIRDTLEAEGIQVILTRDDDMFIPLWRRSEIANSTNADLFISIHANASRARRLKGFEVYYLSEAVDDDARAVAATENASLKFEDASIYEHSSDLETILWDLELTENRRNSIELGNSILGEVDCGKKSLKSARFYVLKGARVPAVLVEVGYITNPDECSKLGWKDYRAGIANKIARGILGYKKRFESSDGFSK